MFERILVAIDQSAVRVAVIAAARDVAVKSRSTVLVAHIREVGLPATMAATAGRAGALPRGAVVEDEEAANRLVQSAVDELRAADVEVEGRVDSGWGATAKELLVVAREFRPDLVVVGSRGSHVSQLMLGSVAHQVVHLAPCPVLVVR